MNKDTGTSGLTSIWKTCSYYKSHKQNQIIHEAPFKSNTIRESKSPRWYCQCTMHIQFIRIEFYTIFLKLPEELHQADQRPVHLEWYQHQFLELNVCLQHMEVKKKSVIIQTLLSNVFLKFKGNTFKDLCMPHKQIYILPISDKLRNEVGNLQDNQSRLKLTIYSLRS